MVRNPKGEKISYAFNLLPSGMSLIVSEDGTMLITGLINPKVNAFIGSGVVVHIPSLFNELDTLERKGKLSVPRVGIQLIDRLDLLRPTIHL